MNKLLPVLIILIAGCATGMAPDRDYQQAVKFQMQGDWDAARESWARAVANIDDSSATIEQQAVYHYEYGRSLGMTCHFDEAERELLEAYRLDAESDGPDYMSLTELARLNLDQKKYAESALYFERLLVYADERTPQPVEMAEILDEYAAALAGTGNETEAEIERKKGEAIRREYPQAASMTERAVYGSQCHGEKRLY